MRLETSKTHSNSNNTSSAPTNEEFQHSKWIAMPELSTQGKLNFCMTFM